MKRNQKETLLEKLVRVCWHFSGKPATFTDEPWQHVDQRYGNQRKMRARWKVKNRRSDRAKAKEKVRREDIDD